EREVADAEFLEKSKPGFQLGDDPLAHLLGPTAQLAHPDARVAHGERSDFADAALIDAHRQRLRPQPASTASGALHGIAGVDSCRGIEARAVETRDGPEGRAPGEKARTGHGKPGSAARAGPPRRIQAAGLV